MWQNLIVLGIVATAVSYVVWTIYRGITKAAGGACGGCGSCGSKNRSGDQLVQLSSAPKQTETPASAEEPSTVSSP
ncbi:FeoB-associated Cys-rich membrane protein [Blastopirellula marina]|uniref:FeoB-associated Cys-rich membrane protein n=1 Tax=Blastopirellula marina TaxID=124 RepID=A0A2S8G265_9BACT|nr:FeoB-associated Cys-rich membrane protein [Blastopirellula marina]PQO38400.1 hypothetical protein C5Y98_10070 [Blastopirellula marina]PTL45057.1 hypothetical protein C5Y97_10080 [Blastopirellula marina]